MRCSATNPPIVPFACSVPLTSHALHVCTSTVLSKSLLFFRPPRARVVAPFFHPQRHRKKVAKLGKPADQRKALMRSLTTEVIRHGRVTTTLVRARAVRGHVDAMIGLAKEGSLHSRRQALGYIYDKPLVHSLFEAAPERYGERNGGYCRVLRTLPRRGDNAKMAVIELV